MIFMEYCPEGTLEALVTSTEAGLEESMVRRYTRQLLQVGVHGQEVHQATTPGRSPWTGGTPDNYSR